MTRDQQKSLIERLHALWNTGDLTAVRDVYSPDFIVHWPERKLSRGHDGAEAAIRKTRTAFPDWYEKVVDMVVEGDRVVTRYVSTGTHKGSYKGIQPTGAHVEIDEISIYRIERGMVAEQWCLFDDVALMRQLGR